MFNVKIFRFVRQWWLLGVAVLLVAGCASKINDRILEEVKAEREKAARQEQTQQQRIEELKKAADKAQEKLEDVLDKNKEQ